MSQQIDSVQLFKQATDPRTIKPGKGSRDEKLKGVVQQFEAIFIQRMYSEMRKNIPNDGVIKRSNADEIFIQMQDQEAAKITAQQGGIGLTDMMMEQLLKQ